MPHLLDMDLATAAAALAARALQRRQAPPGLAEKRALAGSDILSSLGGLAQAHPLLTGAAAGAGLGGLAGLASGSDGLDDASRRRSRVRRAVTGLLAGGLGGLGVGVAASSGVKLPTGPSAPAAPAADAAAPGGFAVDGKRYQVDAAALRAHPELAGRLHALTTPSLRERIMGSLGAAGRTAHDWAPFSTTMLPAMGALDFARNQLSQVPKEWSKNYEHFTQGLKAVGQNKQHALKDLANRLATRLSEQQKQELFAGTIQRHSSQPQGPLQRLLGRFRDEAPQHLDQRLGVTVSRGGAPATRLLARRGDLRQILGEGVAAHARDLEATGVAPKGRAFADLREGLFGGQKMVTHGPWQGMRGLGRKALYALPLALDVGRLGYQALNEAQGREEQLRGLLGQYAKETS